MLALLRRVGVVSFGSMYQDRSEVGSTVKGPDTLDDIAYIALFGLALDVNLDSLEFGSAG